MKLYYATRPGGLVLFFLLCFVTLESQARVESVTLAEALHKARKALAKLSLPQDDMQHLADYFEFYASWYAAVTPAPLTLYESLPEQALKFKEKIRKIAKVFLKKTDRRLMGASRLNGMGKQFYEKVVQMLRAKASLCDASALKLSEAASADQMAVSGIAIDD